MEAAVVVSATPSHLVVKSIGRSGDAFTRVSISPPIRTSKYSALLFLKNCLIQRDSAIVAQINAKQTRLGG